MKFKVKLKNEFMRDYGCVNLNASTILEASKMLAEIIISHYHGDNVAAGELYYNDCFIMRVMTTFVRPCIEKLPHAHVPKYYKFTGRTFPGRKAKQLTLSL